MKNQIIVYELKKIFTAPIIIALIILSLMVNGFIIVSRAHQIPELSILTDMVERYGNIINEDSLTSWEVEYKSSLAKMNEILEEKTGRVFETASDFHAKLRQESSLWNLNWDEMEWEQITRTTILENYFIIAKSADESYRQIDLNDYGEATVQFFGLTGELAETIRHQYAIGQHRFAESIEANEHLYFFFNGQQHEMHNFLFGQVLRAATFEIIIIGVLLTGYILSYEFDNKTERVMYATKLGRKLHLEKLKTSLLGATIVAVLILGITLIGYFLVYDYTGLWNVQMNSVFLSEPNRFFVLDYSLTFLQYLVAAIGLIFITQLLFVLMIFVLSIIIKNNYITLITFIIIFGFGLQLSNLFPTSSNFLFYAGFTPFWMIFDPHTFFMIGGLSDAFKHFELFTVIIWGLILLALGSYSFKKFKKIDL